MLLRALAIGMTAALVLPAAASAGRAQSGPRTIQFSGQTWTVKSSTTKVGPGPNHFSSDPANVWVDAAGRLHLRITKRKGRWSSAEVVSAASFGHGTYRWELDSPVGGLDPNVVLGLFTWHDDPAYANRELDIEMARWGSAGDPTNAQYTVQPWDAPGHLHRFTMPSAALSSTHELAWWPGQVGFRTLDGAGPLAPPIATWTYTGADVPVPGGEQARMNLWLYRGLAPSDGRDVEVVIRSFAHVP